MKRDEKINWFLYWLGIAFILSTISLASVAKADDDNCEDDPICIPKDWPVAERCTTECYTDSLGITRCVTRCYDKRGARV
jgi:hypothetical protein